MNGPQIDFLEGGNSHAQYVPIAIDPYPSNWALHRTLSGNKAAVQAAIAASFPARNHEAFHYPYTMRLSDLRKPAERFTFGTPAEQIL